MRGGGGRDQTLHSGEPTLTAWSAPASHLDVGTSALRPAHSCRSARVLHLREASSPGNLRWCSIRAASAGNERHPVVIRRRWLMAVLSCALSLSACGDTAAVGSATTTQGDPVAVTKPDATSPSPVTATSETSAKKTEADPGVVTKPDATSPVPVTATFVTVPAAIMEGTLHVDGRCLYLNADSTLAVLLVAAGSRWESASATLVFPDGTSFREGDTVRGGGGYLSIDTVALEFPDAAIQLEGCMPGTSTSESSTVALLVDAEAP